jgi:hypothetical protein
MLETKIGAGYAGQVEIKLYHGDNQIAKITKHNTGTRKFLEYICNIVSGQKNLSTSNGEIPGKLGLTNSTIPLISYSDIKKTRYSNDSNYAYYSLQFIIPSAYINKGDTFSELCLFPLSSTKFVTDDIYATIKLDKDIIIEDGNTSIIIEWILAFSNAIED